MEPTGPDPISVPAPPRPLSASDLARAAVGGLIGALLGSVIWGFIVAATDYELGIVATGIGLLAGFGVVLLSRDKHGVPLQAIAAVCAVVGIVWGKYFTVVQVVKNELGGDVAPLFSSRSFDLFGAVFDEIFSGFDLLWVAFAVYAAWRIPAGQGFGRWAPGRGQPPAPTAPTV
jgi:hypothetical protein